MLYFTFKLFLQMGSILTINTTCLLETEGTILKEIYHILKILDKLSTTQFFRKK